MNHYEFEQKVKNYMKADGRTQAAIARKLGYKEPTFNKWVKFENRMPDHVIFEFCRLLNLDERQRSELLLLAGYAVDTKLINSTQQTNTSNDMPQEDNKNPSTLPLSKETFKDSLVETVEGHFGFLKRREHIGPTATILAKAQKEIWISGIGIDSITRNVQILQKLLQKRDSLARILAIPPDKAITRDIGTFLGEGPDEILYRVKANLSTLYRELVIDHDGRVEIKTIQQRPSVGYLIIDPNEPNGSMTVEMYISGHNRASDRPIFQLTRQNDSYWFDYFINNYEDLWSKAEHWTVTQANAKPN